MSQQAGPDVPLFRNPYTRLAEAQVAGKLVPRPAGQAG